MNPFNLKAAMLDIPEPSMLELRMQTCAGSSEPLSHYEIMSVDSFNFNRAGSRALHACADPEHFVRGGSERTEMPLKMDHHRPISETPLKWHLLACQWPTIECWLGSFVNFRGSGPPIFL